MKSDTSPSKTILVVEDSKPIAQVHKHIAQRVGLRAVVANTHEETQAILNQSKDFFCAIVDYSLPDAVNGEAIDTVMETGIPTIVMTGMLNASVRETILKRPVVDYIPKETKQAYEYLQQLLDQLQRNSYIKVLVVDDSSPSRNYLSNLLHRHNFKVHEALDGVDALQVLQRHPDIKLVITDQEMPNMNGITLTNRIREKYSKEDMSIIGISGTADMSLTARYIKNGANDYLHKPFCPEEFYCRVMHNIQAIQNIETIRRQANSDYLTGLPNRRYFFHSAERIHKNAASGGNAITVAMMDIDFFKKINDTYGHSAGDEVLKQMANLLREEFTNDLVARFGGEEFCILLSNVSMEEALNRLNIFREKIADTEVKYDEFSIQFSVSIGVSRQLTSNLDALLTLADQNLYKAKSSGRNRIVGDEDDEALFAKKIKATAKDSEAIL